MMDANTEALAMEALDTRTDRCDRGRCTRKVSGSYKGHSLCEQHFQQFVAMQQG